MAATAVNVTSVVKHSERTVDWKSTIEMQVHLPFRMFFFSTEMTRDNSREEKKCQV